MEQIISLRSTSHGGRSNSALLPRHFGQSSVLMQVPNMEENKNDSRMVISPVVPPSRHGGRAIGEHCAILWTATVRYKSLVVYQIADERKVN